MHNFARHSLSTMAIFTMLAASCSTTAERRLSVIETQVRAAESLGDEIQTWSEGVGSVPPSGSSQTVVAFQERATELRDSLEDVDATDTDMNPLDDLDRALRDLAAFEARTDETVSPDARRQLIDRFSDLGERLAAAASAARYALL